MEDAMTAIGMTGMIDEHRQLRLDGTLHSDSVCRLGLRIVGFYRDELGNTYKGRSFKPSADVKRILLDTE